MLDRLVKGLAVSLLLVPIWLGLAAFVWTYSFEVHGASPSGPFGGPAWGAAALAALSALLAFTLGQWMLWLDRLFPGVDRGAVADELFRLSGWELPVAGAAAWFLWSMLHVGPIPVRFLGQALPLVGAFALIALRLRDPLRGPPLRGSLSVAMKELALALDRRSRLRAPICRGTVRPIPKGPDVSVTVSWWNDANGENRVRISTRARNSIEGLTIIGLGVIVWRRRLLTGDPSFDRAAQVNGDPALVRAALHVVARTRAHACLAQGATYGPNGWTFDGPDPEAVAALLHDLIAAAATYTALDSIDEALASNSTTDPVPDVRISCIGELLRRGAPPPASALADGDPRVRVLAAAGVIALSDAERHGAARAVLAREPATVAAGLLTDWENGPVAAALLGTVAETGGPSTIRALERFADRTPDETLKSAATAAIDRVRTRTENEAGRLSTPDPGAGSVSLLPPGCALTLTRDKTST